MYQFDLIPHMTKMRPPDAIADFVDHYVGEAEGTRINTASFKQLKEWYNDNQHRPNIRVFALCEDLQNASN